MATVKIILPRIQSSSFALYRTSAGGDESIIVRRKVEDPTDILHSKSRKLAKQRYNFTLATQHYSRLSPSQKAITRHQIAEVEIVKSHGKTDTKLLMGRQLFISKEIHSLETTQKQTELPYELCIMLVDQGLSPLIGELWLYCTVSGEWFYLPKDEIVTGNWLFSQVPKGYGPYRIYGESEGYIDPLLPEHQAMTENQLKTLHYHKLIGEVPEYSWNWSGTWYRVAKGFFANKNASAIHIISEIRFGIYDGDITIGVKEYTDGLPPEEWMASQTYHVNPTDPDPKIYNTGLSGCTFTLGTTYWVEWRLTPNPTQVWRGNATWWLIE